ncbi:MAG TPA: hypothetical protein VGE39_13540 [Prosthecobacter sp.]
MKVECFRYWSNLPFLLGCAAFAVNRWLVAPHMAGGGFMRSHFNDLWMIPCALPPLLWLYRRLGLRAHDEPPSVSETLSHLIFWSAFCEWLGPVLVARSTGDPWDVVAYAAGALFAGLWWRRHSLFSA